MKIDVYAGTLTMEFDDEVICFNIYKAIKYPSDVQLIQAINLMSQEILEYLRVDEFTKSLG